MSRAFKNHAAALIVCLALILGGALFGGFAFDGVAHAAEPALSHVTDRADLLDASEEADLEAKAQAIEDEYDFGVYMVTVDNYLAFSSQSVFDAARSIYVDYSLGVGPGKDGLMLLLSMDDRDYSLITYGDFGNYAFNDAAREALASYFLDDFADDNWYAGFSDYLEVAELYTDAAVAGQPYGAGNELLTDEERLEAIALSIAAIIFIPLIIAFIVVAVKTAKMKSVAAATQASAYALGGLRLTAHRDDYSHTTRVVTRVQSSGGGSGGSSISRGGGFSGTSGKF